MIASALELHRLATKRKSRVVTALTMLKTHLFKYQGHVGAALVLGSAFVTRKRKKPPPADPLLPTHDRQRAS